MAELTAAQSAFQKKVTQSVNPTSTQRDVLKAAGVPSDKKVVGKTEASPEKKAGAQRQPQPKVQKKPKAPKVERRASLKAAGKARSMSGHGLSSRSFDDPQRRIDVMRAAGYPEKRISDWMQQEGQRLLQQGWERQNVGRFQPP
jgi:hypothetical protein